MNRQLIVFALQNNSCHTYILTFAYQERKCRFIFGICMYTIQKAKAKLEREANPPVNLCANSKRESERSCIGPTVMPTDTIHGWLTRINLIFLVLAWHWVFSVVCVCAHSGLLGKSQLLNFAFATSFCWKRYWLNSVCSSAPLCGIQMAARSSTVKLKTKMLSLSLQGTKQKTGN